MSIPAGAYQQRGGTTLSGGTAGATVTLPSSSAFQLLGGTLDNLTFSGADLSFAGTIVTLTVTYGLNLSDHALNLTGNAGKVTFTTADETLDHLTLFAHPGDPTRPV